MASDPKMRASDADRERTAALLREHLAAGRLDEEEFHERLTRCLPGERWILEPAELGLPGVREAGANFDVSTQEGDKYRSTVDI